jgi:hypothetical protein
MVETTWWSRATHLMAARKQRVIAKEKDKICPSRECPQ